MFNRKKKKTGLEIPEFRKPTAAPASSQEEWVWVEGYKGTDKNMRCLDFQYELGTQYDIPEEQEVEECKNGFHLCLSLTDVFGYYSVIDGNRFFRVQALVRKIDRDEYGSRGGTFNIFYSKLVAKSIIFTSELTYDEILKDTDAEDLPEIYKQMAIDSGVECAVSAYRKDILVEDGYSDAFATHIAKIGKFDIAHAVGSQKDLSMDIKVLAILYDI